MKYTAVIMVPTVVEFENPGSAAHVKNQAFALCNNFQSVKVGEEKYEPRVMGCYPRGHFPEQPLVFDPPPMAA